MKIIPRSEWATGKSGSNGRFGTVRAITCHWPADGIRNHSADYNAVKRALQGYQRYHKNTRGWVDIGYNFAIDKAGRVWEGRGLHNVGAHAASKANPRANTTRIGVIFILGPGDTVSPEMWARFLELRDYILKTHPQATKIEGHRQVPGAATTCPGPAVMAAINGNVKPSPGKPAPSPDPAPAKPGSKSISAMASEVIAGKHGNGHDNRRKSLGIDAATYAKVRAEVNRRAGGGGGASKPSTPAPSRTIAAMAEEVIAGKHGNGHANRRKSLGLNAATYGKVRAEVNRRLSGKGGSGGGGGGGKSISTMADEVIKGQHGTGHAARRKSLGISAAQYAKVRAEVNKRMK